jgi:hypothetical protein
MACAQRASPTRAFYGEALIKDALDQARIDLI